MLVEAVMKPLRVKLPRDGGEVMLHPGVPVDLPPRIALKLIIQVKKGRVRLAGSLEADWLTLWRHVAEISSGLEPNDPRLPSVMAAIGKCDQAFMQDNRAAFLVAVEGVMQAMEG